MSKRKTSYPLIAVFICLSVVLLMSGMLDTKVAHSHAYSYQNAKELTLQETAVAMERVTHWMQDNSEELTVLFSEPYFHDYFMEYAGENVNAALPVQVKLKGSKDAFVLSNSNYFEKSSAPVIHSFRNGEKLDLNELFAEANFPKAQIRIMLLGVQDSGSLYVPTFRIDVRAHEDSSHAVARYALVQGVYENKNRSVSFYGREFVHLNSPQSDCSSRFFRYDGFQWQEGLRNANCVIASQGEVKLQGKVFGSVFSQAAPGITLFEPVAKISGMTCEGQGCNVVDQIEESAWDDYCDTGKDLLVEGAYIISSGGCYERIFIRKDSELILTQTKEPYYVKHIEYEDETSRISVQRLATNEQVQFYVEHMNVDTLAENRLRNVSNSPGQFHFFYLGKEKLVVNRNRDLSATMYAPHALVVLEGRFDFLGSIHARGLIVNDRVNLHYAEKRSDDVQVADLHFHVRGSGLSKL